MKVGHILALGVLLSGCAGVHSTPMMPFATGTIAAAQTEIHLPSKTVASSQQVEKSPTPVPVENLPTAESSIPCDPTKEDFCVVEGHFILDRPILLPGNDDVESTYRYGATQNGSREPHHGVEFPNPSGTPVHAAEEGVVIFAGSDLEQRLTPWSNFYGNAVVIEHAHGDRKVFTLYGHLSKVDVAVGQLVAKGEKIGEVGAAGAAIGSHLHYEVRLDENHYDATRNPVLWLIPKSGTGSLAVRAVDEDDQHLAIHLNIQRLTDTGALQQITQPEAYDFNEKHPVSSDDSFMENIALSDLPEGKYRLTVVYFGKLYERFIEVESGKLTLVIFILE